MIHQTAIIHPTATIHSDAQIGRYVRIGPNAVVGADPLLCKFDKDLDRRVRTPCDAGVIVEDYVDIGSHCVIMLGSKRDTVIGEGTFLGAFTNIGHDCRIGRICLIVNGTLIAGWVEMGENTFVGMGTKIREKTKIGNDCFIGMGSLVVDNIPRGTYGFGSPFEVREKRITVKKILRRLRR